VKPARKQVGETKWEVSKNKNKEEKLPSKTVCMSLVNYEYFQLCFKYA